jgi:hypothetical protein
MANWVELSNKYAAQIWITLFAVVGVIGYLVFSGPPKCTSTVHLSILKNNYAIASTADSDSIITLETADNYRICQSGRTVYRVSESEGGQPHVQWLINGKPSDFK